MKLSAMQGKTIRRMIRVAKDEIEITFTDGLTLTLSATNAKTTAPGCIHATCLPEIASVRAIDANQNVEVVC